GGHPRYGDQRPPQSFLAGVFADHAAVGNDVRAPDLEDAAFAGREFHCRQQYATASSIEMGCVRVTSQRGQIMTGSRSVRALTSSNETLPAPMTADARNSMVSTPDLRRIFPTSWRLRKWGESSGSLSSPRPPRAMMAPTPG